MTSDRHTRTLRVRARTHDAGASPIDASLVHSLRLAVDRGLIEGWHADEALESDAFELVADDGWHFAPDAVASLITALDAGADTADARVLPGSLPVPYSKYTGESTDVPQRGVSLQTVFPVHSGRRVFEPAATVYFDDAVQTSEEASHRPGALDRLKRLVGPHAGADGHHPVSTLGQHPEHPRPLEITVVIPTQASRPEMLKDALLCLSAQSIDSFEVRLVVTDAVEEDAVDLASLVARSGQRMRDRIEVISGGTRQGEAMGTALASANGRMLLVVHETDVFDSALLARILRYEDVVVVVPAVRQLVEPELWPGDQDGYRPLATPDLPEPGRLSVMQHRRFAVPMHVVDRFGVELDLDDNVAAWADLVDRVAAVTGVVELADRPLTVRAWYGLDDASADERRFADDAMTQWLDRRPDSFVHSIEPEHHQPPPMDPDAAHVHRMLFSGGSLRRPVRLAWRLIRPVVVAGASVRRRLRRHRDG